MLKRALYGLRTAPRYWSQLRDKVLRGINIKTKSQIGNRKVVLKESKTETGLWKIVEELVDDDVIIGEINIKAMKDGERPTANRELFLRECKSEAGLWKKIGRAHV